MESKNNSNVKILSVDIATKHSKQSQPSHVYISPCKELLDIYGIKLNWYQRWYLRLLDKRLTRYLSEIDEYDG